MASRARARPAIPSQHGSPSWQARANAFSASSRAWSQRPAAARQCARSACGQGTNAFQRSRSQISMLRSAACRASSNCPAKQQRTCHDAGRPGFLPLAARRCRGLRGAGKQPHRDVVTALVRLVHAADRQHPGGERRIAGGLGLPQASRSARAADACRPACTSTKASSRRISAISRWSPADRAATSARFSTTAPSPSKPRTACTRAEPSAVSTSASTSGSRARPASSAACPRVSTPAYW